MTYEEFLKIIEGSTLTEKAFADLLGGISQYSCRRNENKDLDNTIPYVLYNEESIGGTGGSC